MAEGSVSINQLRKAIEQNPPARILKRVTSSGTFEAPKYSRVKEEIQKEIKLTSDKNPDVPVEKIHTVYIPYFGSLLLDERTHLQGAETKEQKELSARIQHTFADHIYTATEDPTSDLFTINIYDLVRETQSMSELSDFGQNYNLLSFWNGVKAEIAVIRALRKDQAFTVILPDFLQDPTRTNPFDNQVLQWDVNSGIDLIAIPRDRPSHAILVDVKGRKRNESSENSQERPDEKDTVVISQYELDEHKRKTLNSCVRKTLDANNITTVSRARVEIPTAGGFLGTVSNLPHSPSDGNYKGALEHFTSLRSDLTTFMREQLQASRIQATLVAA